MLLTMLLSLKRARNQRKELAIKKKTCIFFKTQSKVFELNNSIASKKTAAISPKVYAPVSKYKCIP